MNYTLLCKFIECFSDDLVERFGVPREAANEISQYAEAAAVCAEAKSRKERQMEMDFKRYGSRVMGKRYGITPRAARKRFNRIISEPKTTLKVPAQVPLNPFNCHHATKGRVT